MWYLRDNCFVRDRVITEYFFFYLTTAFHRVMLNTEKQTPTILYWKCQGKKKSFSIRIPNRCLYGIVADSMLKQGLNFMAYTSALDGFFRIRVFRIASWWDFYDHCSLYLDVITRVLIGEFLLHDRNDNKFNQMNKK